jgi:hypothetical protein
VVVVAVVCEWVWAAAEGGNAEAGAEGRLTVGGVDACAAEGGRGQLCTVWEGLCLPPNRPLSLLPRLPHLQTSPLLPRPCSPMYRCPCCASLAPSVVEAYLINITNKLIDKSCMSITSIIPEDQKKNDNWHTYKVSYNGQKTKQRNKNLTFSEQKKFLKMISILYQKQQIGSA